MTSTNNKSIAVSILTQVVAQSNSAENIQFYHVTRPHAPGTNRHLPPLHQKKFRARPSSTGLVSLFPPFPIPSFPATYIRRDEGSTSSRDSGGGWRSGAPEDGTERADGGQVPVSVCEGERDGQGRWIEGWGGGDAEEGVFGLEGIEE